MAKRETVLRREPDVQPPPYRGHDTFMPYVLNRATSALNADFQVVLRKHDMTLLHWRVLAFLTETDGLGVSALGRYTGVDQATLSRALTVMEKAGYVARGAFAQDRRVVAIKILPAGRRQFRRLLPLAWDIYARAVSGLDLGEQNTLHRLLNLIRKNLTG